MADNIKLTHIEDSTTNITAGKRRRMFAYDTTKDHAIYYKNDGTTLRHFLMADSSNVIVNPIAAINISDTGYIGLGATAGRIDFALDVGNDIITVKAANLFCESDLYMAGSLVHIGDTDTSIGFTPNLVTINAGGVNTLRVNAGTLTAVQTAGKQNTFFETFSTSDTDNSTIRIIKSSSATIDTFATTNNGEYLGSIYFGGINAAATPGISYGAAIIVNQALTAGSTYLGADMYFHTGTNSLSARARMSVYSTGHVDIKSELSIGGIAANETNTRLQSDFSTGGLNGSTGAITAYDVLLKTSGSENGCPVLGFKTTSTIANKYLGGIAFNGYSISTSAQEDFGKILCSKVSSDVNGIMRFYTRSNDTDFNGLALVGNQFYIYSTITGDITLTTSNSPSTRTIGVERVNNASAGVPGDNLIISAGGAYSGEIDLAGGNVYIRPGISTGAGISYPVIQRANRSMTAGGSTDSTFSDAIIVPPRKALTKGSAVDLFTVIFTASGQTCGGMLSYRIHCWNGTDFQSHCGIVNYAAGRKGTTVTSAIGHSSGVGGLETEIKSSGTITDTFAITNATGGITITCNANPSLTPSTGEFYIEYTIHNDSGISITIL